MENYWRSNMQFDISMTTEKPDVQWQYWLFNKLLFWSGNSENSCYLTCVNSPFVVKWFISRLAHRSNVHRGVTWNPYKTDHYFTFFLSLKFFQNCTILSVWIQFHVGLLGIFVTGTRSLLTWILSKLSFILLLLHQIDFFFSLHWWNWIMKTTAHQQAHLPGWGGNNVWQHYF